MQKLEFREVKELLRQGWKFRKRFHHEKAEKIDLVDPAGRVVQVDYKHYHRCRNQKIAGRMEQSDDGYCYCGINAEGK